LSEFRYDPIKRTWVILSTERGRRPNQYLSSSQALIEPKICPFCEGNETMTPPEVFSIRGSMAKDSGYPFAPESEPDSPGWRVRVVPNKFPALTETAPGEVITSPDIAGIHSSIPGSGVHEIIIETPVKDRQMADMDANELEDILLVYQERLKTHLHGGKYKTVFLFKNHGKEAGASLVHSHAQIMALPIVPSNVASELRSFEEHRKGSGSCLMCGILEKEAKTGTRVVLDEGGYVVLAPYAASSPFQLQIVPKDHHDDFSHSNEIKRHHLAYVLGTAVRSLRSVLGEHPWNMVLHNAPANLEDGWDVTAYHWFIEITPHLTRPAGFEMGSGIYINIVAPEEYAEILRTKNVE